jgi:hypothetical protein
MEGSFMTDSSPKPDRADPPPNNATAFGLPPERRFELLGRLLREARPYYPRLICSLLLGVIAGLGPVAYSPAFGLIIDRVFNDHVHDMRILWMVVIGLFVVNLVANAASYGLPRGLEWSAPHRCTAGAALLEHPAPPAR